MPERTRPSPRTTIRSRAGKKRSSSWSLSGAGWMAEVHTSCWHAWADCVLPSGTPRSARVARFALAFRAARDAGHARAPRFQPLRTLKAASKTTTSRASQRKKTTRDAAPHGLICWLVSLAMISRRCRPVWLSFLLLHVCGRRRDGIACAREDRYICRHRTFNCCGQLPRPISQTQV